MFRVGLRLGSTSKQRIKDAVVLYERGLCDYIELLVEPGSYDNYISVWKALNIPYVIQAAHFQHGLSLSSHSAFERNMKMAFEALKFADALIASRVIFHPGAGNDIHEVARQLNVLRDTRIVVENMPHHISSGQVCVGSKPEDILFLQQETGAGFCLDFGHAICAANVLLYDQKEFIQKMLSLNPTMFHLADGDNASVFSRYYHFGAGSYDFSSFAEKIPMNAAVTVLCPHSHNESLDDFVADALFVKKLAKKRIEKTLVLREAFWSDVNNLFDLANDSDVRLNSFSQGKISFTTHLAWFAKNGHDKETLLFIVSYENEFVGTVRFASENGSSLLDAKISISLHKKIRGLGLGAKILNIALELAKDAGTQVVWAYIFDHNIASKKLFLGADFITHELEYVGERVFRKYSKRLT